MRKLVIPEKSRELNLKKQSEREKSIRISGVKMFDPDHHSRTDPLSHRYTHNANANRDQISGGSAHQIAAVIRKSQEFISNEFETMVITPNSKDREDLENAIAAQQGPDIIDSYDGISTENKSPSGPRMHSNLIQPDTTKRRSLRESR